MAVVGRNKLGTQSFTGKEGMPLTRVVRGWLYVCIFGCGGYDNIFEEAASSDLNVCMFHGTRCSQAFSCLQSV